MKVHEQHRQSGIDWLPVVPSHWEVKPLFTRFRERFEKNADGQEGNVLSLSYGRIIPRDVSSNFGLLPESFNTYQIVYPNDVIIRPTDLQNDDRSLRVGQAKQRGIITSAYICLEPQDIEAAFAHYLLHGYDLLKIYYKIGGGVRQTLKYEDLKRLPVLIPSRAEQQQISAFLDVKTQEIDKLIANKRKLVGLLKEERTAIIHQAVTRGINPDAKLKPSGIEWLGDIPEHWTQSKLAYISKIVRGASPRPAGDIRYFNGDHTPWITVAEVTKDDSKFIVEVSEYLTEEGAKHSRFVDVGTLLLSNSGATLGVPKILKLGGCINDGSVALLNISDSVEKEFLYYYLKSLTQTYRDLMKGSGQPNLNTDIVKGTSFCYPDINEQMGIVAQIENRTNEIDKTILKVEKEISLIREYRTSLIAEVVTGRIKVC